TSCGVPSGVPTWPVRLSPELFEIRAAAPTAAVALKVIGLPVSPAAVAVSVFGPARGPSRHDVTCAVPVVAVEMGSTGSTLPPPDATANVTDMPNTGFPL